MNDVKAKVSSVALVNNNVYQVKLTVPTDSFIAGQYLLIQLPTGETVPYSIGSAPFELPELTLYILVAEVGSLADKVVQHIQQSDEISIKIAAGDSHIENGAITETTERILLVAGGTGFAQMKSMYDSLKKQPSSAEVALYWGVRTTEDLFLEEWTQQQANNVKVVVGEADPSWQGATGWLYDYIIAEQPSFKNTIVYVSGSPAMVYGTLDKLEEAGLPRTASYSDVFAYAPRPD
ncbi:NAD(P)H-flavin reductase [Marinomonas agarivorans]|nr:NAD(P)H-flavin reductase [Marinomonas agarivorans]